jgi:hypothetical protein
MERDSKLQSQNSKDLVPLNVCDPNSNTEDGEKSKKLPSTTNLEPSPKNRKDTDSYQIENAMKEFGKVRP